MQINKKILLICGLGLPLYCAFILIFLFLFIEYSLGFFYSVLSISTNDLLIVDDILITNYYYDWLNLIAICDQSESEEIDR